MSSDFNPDFLRDIERVDDSRIEREVVYLEQDDDEQESPSEDDDEPLSAEEQAEIEAEEEAERRREERRLRREANPFWQFISGNWLITERVSEAYIYLVIVAGVLFLSVVSIFTSLKLDQTYAESMDNLQLLRERSLEYRQVRFERTSHSAITKELKRRGIPLYEPKEAKMTIK